MKISITYLFAGLIAWAFVLAVYLSFTHYPLQTLVIPFAFLVHIVLRQKFR